MLKIGSYVKFCGVKYCVDKVEVCRYHAKWCTSYKAPVDKHSYIGLCDTHILCKSVTVVNTTIKLK